MILWRYDSVISGYRYFLIEAPPGKTIMWTGIRTDAGRLRADGGDDRRAPGRVHGRRERLSIRVPESCGLGLLLGTIGLAAVQLRSVLERRRELALLRAAGFRRGSLARLIVLENLVLLTAGLGVGMLSALVAVLPHLLGHGASIPWKVLALMLGLVFATGLLASLAAVRAVVR